MKSTRLNEILSSLSKEEFIKLNEFLHSPYLNKNKQVILFYYFLSAKQVHPDYSGIKREEVFEYIYKGQEFNLDKYLKVSSDYVKAIENFLILELRSGRELQNQRTLLEIAGSRDLTKTFAKYSGEINTKIENEFNKDLDFYLAEYESKVESMLYNLNTKKFDLEKSLLGINDTVNLMFAHSKLELMIKLFHISPKKNKIWFDSEVIEYVKKNENHLKQYHPMIYLRNQILKMFSDSDVKIYKQIKSFVSNNEKRINKENLQYVYDKMLTFCSINETAEFKSEEFQIIKSMEKNSLLAEDGIDYIYFLKIIDTALSENDAYWAESFLKNYASKIDSELRESTVNLAMASICIYRQKFKEALDHIAKVSSHNDYFYLSSKTISMIIFYELDDIPSVNYVTGAFATYLNRSKGKNYIDYEEYKTFLDLFKQLTNEKLRKKMSVEMNSIIEKSENHKFVLNKDWIMRKLARIELGNKNN